MTQQLFRYRTIQFVYELSVLSFFHAGFFRKVLVVHPIIAIG